MNIRAKIFGGEKAPDDKPVLPSKQPRGAKADALESVAVAREESRRVDNRNEDRHRLIDEQVRVTHNGASYDVQLVNLSGGGAMVAAEFRPKLWDRVDLHLGNHGTTECAVLWIRPDRIGLEFAHETRLDCSADEQAAVLREVIARSFPDVEFDVDATEAVPPSAADEQRRAARHPLIWSGLLHHDYQSTPVRIRNISSTGAMIEAGTPVRVGAEPLLEIGDAASISATVEWAVGDQVGVRFHTPFDMNLLARARPELATSRWVKPAYLDAPHEDSPWDPRWKRLSLGELKQELEGFLKR